MRNLEFRVYPKYALCFSSSDKKRVLTRYDISKERTNTKGQLSNISIRKIKHAINNLVFISENKKHLNEKGEEFNFKINLITLTLPSAQVHTDKELKALLNDWLKIHEKKGLKNYVWKAEKQKNGNIHFHITSDHYIHWRDIKTTWNLCLKRLGYIDKYRKTQEQWHKEGFKFRTNTIRNIKGKKVEWTFDQQKEAYIRGKKENWSNPNTTDVHSVQKIKHLAAYLSEYMAKKKGEDIEGRIWGCSHNLLLKPDNLQHIEHQIIHGIFNREDIQDRIIKGDFYSILPYSKLENDILSNFKGMLDRFKAKLKAYPE